MIWDNLSIAICIRLIEATLKKEEVTVWQIALEYFDKPGISEYDARYKYKKRQYYTAKANLVKLRLDKLEENGLVSIDKENGKKVYEIDSSRLFLKTSAFLDGKKRQFLCVKDKREKWDAFEI